MRNVGDGEFDVDVTVGIAHTAGIGITDISGAEIDAVLLEIIAELLALVMQKLLVVAVVAVAAAAAAAVDESGGE